MTLRLHGFPGLVGLLAFLALCPTTRWLHAEEQVAFVMACEGDVQVLEEGKTAKKPAKQMPLFDGDKVVTKKNGSCVLMMEDKTIVELQANTTLTLTEMTAKKRGIVHTYSMESGRSFFSVTESKGKRTTIKTPTAIAGVRSTELAVEVEEGGTYVAVLQGEAEVESLDTREKIRLGPDEEAQVPRKGKPLRRKLFKLKWAKEHLPKFQGKVAKLVKSHPVLAKKIQAWRSEKKKRGWKHLRQMRKQKLKEKGEKREKRREKKQQKRRR